MLTNLLLLLENEQERKQFTEIYQLCKNKMISAAFQICHDTDTAEDITQEAFVRMIGIFEKIKTMDNIRLLSLGIVIAKNIAIDRWRKKKAAKRAEERLKTNLFSQPAEEKYLAKAQKEELISAIYTLKEIYSEPLMLRYYHDLSIKQISKLLNISYSTAKQRICRGKRLIYKALKEMEK
ncbi:RNA polymerase sigma factor [Massiliimalia massiliensis]|uniref:RNA polymerase sigma factor n=1 Tax=Massiliimalia massiliensis TaxID=1852384 RepID=UPI0013564414|nr:RNA polymerase sigma factor [Massiliimalia massiliensis]